MGASAGPENHQKGPNLRLFESRWVILSAASALLALIGVVDALTGPELGFGVVYFIPVALVAWRLGRTPALATALAATVVWHVVDRFSGLPYPSPWYGLWNAATRATSFVAIALLVSALRAAEKRQTQINHELTQNFRALEESSARIKELQGQFQLVCSWTNRIRSEGRWMRFEEFMQRNFNMEFSHGISEEALTQMAQQIEGAAKTEGVAPRSSSG